MVWHVLIYDCASCVAAQLARYANIHICIQTHACAQRSTTIFMTSMHRSQYCNLSPHSRHKLISTFVKLSQSIYTLFTEINSWDYAWHIASIYSDIAFIHSDHKGKFPWIPTPSLRSCRLRMPRQWLSDTSSWTTIVRDHHRNLAIAPRKCSRQRWQYRVSSTRHPHATGTSGGQRECVATVRLPHKGIRQSRNRCFTPHPSTKRRAAGCGS